MKKKQLLQIILAFTFLATAVNAQPLPIMVINTNDSGPGSLRQAALNAQPGATINFATHLDGETIGLTGGLILLNKDITIDASNLDALTIDANNTDRHFSVEEGVTTQFRGLTLINGNTTEYGGAIYNLGNTLIEHCNFSNNQTTAMGGALANVSGTPASYLEVRNSTFTGNESGQDGGAVWSGSNTVLANCTFDGNYCIDDGGAIATTRGTISLEACTVINNTADDKAGGVFLHALDDTSTVTNCYIDGNTSDGGGGGLFSSQTLIMMGTTISNNRDTHPSISYGGAILNWHTIIATNCTFSGNSVVNLGGAIVNNGVVILDFCTITENASIGYGGGIYNGSNAQCILGNTIIAGNTASNTGHDIWWIDGGSIISHGYNILGNSAINTTFPATTGDQLDVDPTLEPLQDDGSGIPTHAAMCSPAIDAANPAATVSTDQRGIPRPYGTAPDIGAYEFQAGNPQVYSTADDGSCGTLRSVIASAPAGAAITFAPGLDGATISLLSGEIVIDKNLVIDASVISSLIVDGNNSSRIFRVMLGATVEFYGLTFINGSAAGGAAVHNTGSAAFNDCEFSNNNASLYGGAIHSSEVSSSLEIQNCEFSNNEAPDGGAIFCESGSLNISNSTVS